MPRAALPRVDPVRVLAVVWALVTFVEWAQELEARSGGRLMPGGHDR